MNENVRELLTSYIKENVAPILVDFVEGENIPNSVVLDAKTDISELNGHYNNAEFEAPKWLNKLEEYVPSILVIDKIDSLRKEEQKKFIEILKYRKVSTFELPEKTIIIVTAKEINEKTIDEEVYSLVAHIKE